MPETGLAFAFEDDAQTMCRFHIVIDPRRYGDECVFLLALVDIQRNLKASDWVFHAGRVCYVWWSI